MAVASLADSATEQRELAQIIANGFVVSRLRVLARASVNAAAIPALVLWLDSFIRLPFPAVWLALAIWPACVAMAIAGAALERTVRRGLETKRTAARQLPDVQFGFPPPPPLSEWLAATAGAGLWVHGVAPLLVAPAGLAAAQTAWALLVAAVILTARTAPPA